MLVLSVMLIPEIEIFGYDIEIALRVQYCKCMIRVSHCFCFGHPLVWCVASSAGSNTVVQQSLGSRCLPANNLRVRPCRECLAFHRPSRFALNDTNPVASAVPHKMTTAHSSIQGVMISRKKTAP